MAESDRIQRPWYTRCGTLLGGLVLLHLVVSTLWIRQDLSLRSYDGAPHLDAQIHAARMIGRQGFDGLQSVIRPFHPGWWPSTGYLPLSLLTLLLGEDLRLLRLFNLGYLVLLLVSVYHIGGQLHSNRAGLLAAALVGVILLVYGEARNYGIDMPSAAMLSLCVWLLLRTRGYSRPWSCVGLGVALGWGVLVRPQVALFFAPLGVAVLALALWRPGLMLVATSTRRWRMLAGALLAALLGMAVSSPWWLGNLQEILTILSRHQRDAVELSGNIDPGPVFYLKVLPWALSLWLLPVFVVALSGWRARGVAARWRRHPMWPLVWIWLVAGLLVILAIKVHFVRFLLPVCPAFALITAIGLASITARRVRRAVITLVLVVAGGSWLVDSLVWRTSPEVILPQGWCTRRPLGDTTGPPRRDPVIVAVARLARQLRLQYGDGTGLVIQFGREAPYERHRWAAGPVVRLVLPGARVDGQTYVARLYHEQRPFINIGGTVLAPLATPAKSRTLYMTFLNRPPYQVEQVAGKARKLLAQIQLKTLHPHWVILLQ